jgi:hypothetical protein
VYLAVMPLFWPSLVSLDLCRSVRISWLPPPSPCRTVVPRLPAVIVRLPSPFCPPPSVLTRACPLAVWRACPLAVWRACPLAVWRACPLAVWRACPLAVWRACPLDVWRASRARFRVVILSP